ncbi:mas-related G-protein coupled receptor member X2-like [Erinaceus europaeus]|uniref:Mas-related G-protein coupled receptor member X2-like n=1 Tax=Erinaceus europaeus TaxID=9365 RepID=A0ABM3WAA4_ERIEU|nr:mas-related G-protein coupled receptor member X2-like [Erinaceus europaeus]
MDSTVSAWGIMLTPLNEDDDELPGNLQLVYLILNFVSFFISLAGLAVNTVVLWLLGFRMQRNAISVYILNLAGSLRQRRRRQQRLQQTLKLVLKRALEDVPGMGQSEDHHSPESLDMSRSSQVS